MAIKTIREVDRLEGFTVASGATIIAGQPVKLNADKEILPWDGASGEEPLALADVHTEQLALAPASGLTAGTGFDYTDFARGGLVGGYIDGGVFDLTDDGRGAPFETGDTYVVMGPVYANSSRKLTSTASSNPKVGMVMEIEGSAPVTRLRIKSQL